MYNYEIIDTYTRDDAINDGELIDISSYAKEAKMNAEIAITRNLQDKIEDKPEIEDINGRTWDVVWMLKCAILGLIESKKLSSNMLLYELILNDNSAAFDDNFIPKMVQLKAVFEFNGHKKLLVTIMLPNED